MAVEMSFGIYLLGYIYTAWRIAGQLAWSFLAGSKRTYPSLYRDKTQPDGVQILGASLCGLVLALAWPLALFFSYLSEQREGLGGSFLYLPKKQKLEIAEKRIKQLERELGVR